MAVAEGSRHATGTATAVSVVIPCLNEAGTIAECVGRARAALSDGGLDGEVIVVDNGSDDGSAELAVDAGAAVVREPRRGYGSAYLAGFAAARGDYVVMADADLTYDFAEIPRFVAALEAGAELVMGNRMGGIQPGAMPWMHRYVGNPLLSGILNLFFRAGVHDAHCGMRAVRRDLLGRLDLRTTGMEFASEMVVRAARERLRIAEIDIEYHPRGGESKLSRYRDGWRHLRFLLLQAPNWLFVIPGAALTVLGLLTEALVLAGVADGGWENRAMIAAALVAVAGTQLVALGLFAHAYGSYFLAWGDTWFHRARRRFRLEHGLLAGLAIALVGTALGAWTAVEWVDGPIEAGEEQRAVLAATLLLIGIQTFFSSFLISILGLRRPDVARQETTPPRPPRP